MLTRLFKRVDNTFLPEHFETGQWLREEGHVRPDEELIITQKLHGASCRLGNVPVRRKPTWKDKIAKFFGVVVQDHEYDLVAGSHTDIWTDALKMYGDRLPKNIVVYGELVGYVPGGGPIQKGHTYDEVPDDYHLYVYRVAIVTEDGGLFDLSWDAVRDFCQRHGFDHVPELDRMPKAVFDVMDFDEKNFHLENFNAPFNETLYTDPPVRLSDGGTGVDEGIAIRVERGITPEIYKYKNKSFYLYESAQLDTGEADLESQG